MKAIERSNISRQRWDELVHSSPDGWVYALSAWLDMIGRVTPWGLEDRSFALEHGGQLVAVVPLHHAVAHRRLASSGWGWVGPVVVGGLHANFEAKVLKAAFREVRTIATDLKIERIDLAAPAVTSRSLANRWGVNPFTAYGFRDVSTLTRVIDLQPDEKELWAGLSADARQQIRRAQTDGYRAAIENWQGLVDAYYRVHCETYARSALPPHPRAYFEGFARDIAPEGHTILAVGRDPAGQPIAFHNAVYLGKGALYATGCSETAHLGSGVNYLLFWEAMLAAKRAGCTWYEAGDVVGADSADTKLRGLGTFKSKFGGEDHRCFRSTLTLAESAAPTVQTSEFPVRSEALAQWRMATRTLVAASLGPHWTRRGARLRKLLARGEAHPGSAPPAPVPNVANDVRDAYQKGDLYAPERICAAVKEQSREYADRLLATKLSLVRRHYPGGLAVDLCCATGGHLIALANDVERGIGIDFAARYVQRAQADAEAHALRHLSFICSDAKCLPLASGKAGLIYSLSSLYAIPKVEDVFAEVTRILRPGGIAVLDLGNSRSLNTYCLRAGYTDWPSTFPIAVAQMQQLCAANQLEVIEHRSFQLLPLWAGKPDWLWPLLHPAWRRLLQRRIGGRMLDEWLSSLPGLRQFAFRHLLVCRKARG